MKLSYEDKVQIYEVRKQGSSLSQLSSKYCVEFSNLKYMIRMINRYGLEVVKKGKNSYYSPELKQEMIDKVLIEGQSRIRKGHGKIRYAFFPRRTICQNG
ncbi:Mobile element protein [Streptococcus oralis]|uniref:Mobile element protein n=1 Tax=Streptococcus oralis TaxID=1303 RepID=A0A139RN39_STROR|nr:Mobile element protein [Streptococcus oralis]